MIFESFSGEEGNFLRGGRKVSPGGEKTLKNRFGAISLPDCFKTNVNRKNIMRYNYLDGFRASDTVELSTAIF